MVTLAVPPTNGAVSVGPDVTVVVVDAVPWTVWVSVPEDAA